MNLSNAIKKLRGKSFTQKEIAELTGVTPVYVCHIETGVKQPSLAWIKKFSLAINVSVPVIFYVAMDEEDAASGMDIEYMVYKPQLDSMFRDCFGIYVI